jgi:hypothetical protein
MLLVLTGDPMPAQSLATRALVWLSDSRLESRCSTANRSSMNQAGVGCACRAAATDNPDGDVWILGDEAAKVIGRAVVQRQRQPQRRTDTERAEAAL